MEWGVNQVKIKNKAADRNEKKIKGDQALAQHTTAVTNKAFVKGKREQEVCLWAEIILTGT